MDKKQKEDRDLLEILEDKILEWELNRTEEKNKHAEKIDEMKKRVKKINEEAC